MAFPWLPISGLEKVDFRIFGVPMESWRDHMPSGMLLKSDGFASNLFDPDASFTLRRFCGELNIPYDDTTVPVKLEHFIDYGLAFRKKMVPVPEERRYLACAGSTKDFSGT